MTATEWNEKYPVGTRCSVLGCVGKTTSLARNYEGASFVWIFFLKTGKNLCWNLAWVHAEEPE